MNLKANLTNKRWVGRSVLLIGLLIVAMPFGVGYMLDDLRVAPLYWLRFESASEFNKTIPLGQVSNKQFSVRFSFEHGSNKNFTEVELLSGTNRVARFGGDESTFLGFRDIDGDGAKELLFTATSSYGSGRTVWKYSSGRWIEVPQSEAAERILNIAELLFYGPLVVFAGILCSLLGLLLVVELRLKLKATAAGLVLATYAYAASGSLTQRVDAAAAVGNSLFGAYWVGHTWGTGR